MRYGGLLHLLGLAACCPEAQTSRFTSAPTGIALDGAAVLVSSERRDAAEGSSRAQVSRVNLEDGSVITNDLRGLHSAQLTTGSRSQLAFGTSEEVGTYPYEAIEGVDRIHDFRVG